MFVYNVFLQIINAKLYCTDFADFCEEKVVSVWISVGIMGMALTDHEVVKSSMNRPICKWIRRTEPAAFFCNSQTMPNSLTTIRR